mgnify:CR=1 FL=1
MPTVLVTGANRGLGLEFVRQYAGEGWRVLACARKASTADRLTQVAATARGRVTIHSLDVSEFGQIDALGKSLAGEPIDVLLNNAGIYGDRAGARKIEFGTLDYDVWARSFRINAMAPIRMVEVFLPNLERSAQKKVVNVTSRMGSIGDNESGASYVYRSSKAALNMATRSLAIDLAPRGILAVVVHPGWVQTDMGGKEAPMGVEESVRGVRNVVDGLTPERSGSFLEYDGEEIPW